MTWSVVVPVKLLRTAKSRLQVFEPTDRAALALAMALDTVAAAVACAEVAEVVVVTDDEQVAIAANGLGARVVADEPAAGLNAALVYGATIARERGPSGNVAAVAADLPAMQPVELARVLAEATGVARAAVADADGDGTVVLTAVNGEALNPAYGEGSLERHRREGAVVLDVDAPGLRRDVDTVTDLRAALALGCGPRTTALAAELLADRRTT
jgi:2-phospho-L-lactate guanylyltransferase